MNDTASTNAPRVNVRQVGLGYAGRRVLDGVDLDVRAGELDAEIGRAHV